MEILVRDNKKVIKKKERKKRGGGGGVSVFCQQCYSMLIESSGCIVLLVAVTDKKLKCPLNTLM